MLKVLHVPYSYFPAASGGTEVYAAALIRELAETGAVMSEVAVPAAQAGSYEHEGVRVHRFALSKDTDWRMIYGTGDKVAARGFGELLEKLKPSLVHFHAYSTGVSVQCLRECQKRRVPAIYTYHTPTTTCVRGTLLRWGRELCDGKMRAMTCSACMLHGLGMPKPLAQLSAWASPLMQWATGCLPDSARWQVPAQVHALSLRRQRDVQEWFTGMASVVALCDWAKELLLRNGVDACKLKTVRHGLTQVIPSTTSSSSNSPTDLVSPVRLVFLGRLNPTKGLEVILDALARIPEAGLSLDVYTLTEDNPGSYSQQMQERISQDTRVRMLDPVPAHAVIDLLRGYDALIVPSQWLETGPLVVLEAFAAGIPVLGSDLGGIAEWVTHEQNGLLVDARDCAAWSGMLQRVSAEKGLLSKLRLGICSPRSMKAVTDEMLTIYKEAALKQN